MISFIKKILLTSILVFLGCSSLFGDHQIGSEMYYEIIGEGAWENSKLYKFNFVVYMKCSHPDTLDYLLVFVNNAVTPLEEESRIIPLDSIRNLEYNFINCNSRPPDICYNKLFYSDTISIREGMLPIDVASKTCCRDIILDLSLIHI